MRTNANMMQKILDENEDQYGYLLSEIKKIENKFKVTFVEEYGSLVNYSMNEAKPIHNWFKYKEAYSEELVGILLNEFETQKGFVVLDPFCGSGTTLLKAKEMGFNSIGYEVNPVSAFVAKAKTSSYTDHDINLGYYYLNSFDLNNIIVDNKDKPKFTIIDKVYNVDQLEKILKIKKYLDSLVDSNSKTLLFSAFVSIIEPASFMKKDGNGIKYRKNYKPQDAELLFRAKAVSMLEDLSNETKISDANCEVITESYLTSDNFDKVDRIIFSPPYANCFDYCSVYKMELWIGGFIREYSDFKHLRTVAIRSHVNSSVSNELEYTYPLINWIVESLRGIELWDKKIPAMLLGYFDDMTKALKKSYEQLNSGGKCAIVIANSSYKGYVVPTDLILCDAASKSGFIVEEIRVSRMIKTSSQQMIMNEDLKMYLRESVIILSKE